MMKEISYDTEKPQWGGAHKTMEPRASSLLTEKPTRWESPQKDINTTTRILTVENQPHANEPQDEEGGETHLGRIIFILLLVLMFGLGVGAYVLIGPKVVPHEGEAEKAKDQAAPAPVATTDSVDILVSNSPRAQILVDISLTFGKTVLTSGETRPLRFLIKGEDGTTRPAISTEFLSAVTKYPISGTLARSLDTSVTYTINSGDTLSGTLTLTSRSYQNTFAGMLDWEGSMVGDLLPVLNPHFNSNDILSAKDRAFHDERIGNIDTRVLVDPLGNTLLIYGFIDKKTLLISGTKEVFSQHTTSSTAQ